MINSTTTAQFAGLQFLGFEHHAGSVQALYAVILDWYKTLGVSPDIAAIHGPGHSGKYVSFKSAHAKLKKAGFEGVTAFELNVEGPKTVYESNWDWNISTSCYFAGVAPRITILAKHPYGQLSPDSLLVAADAVIRTVRPEYGTGYTRETVNGVRDDLAAVGRGRGEIIAGWGNFGLGKRVWRMGKMEGVYPWNFVGEATLSATLEGGTLRDWILAEPARGQIMTMSDALCLWTLDAQSCSRVFSTLWDNGIIFNGEKYLADGQAQVADPDEAASAPTVAGKVEPDKTRLAKRNKLIDKVARLAEQDPDCYVLALVDLEDFFDGNWNESSLAANLMDYGRPPLQECYRILRSIRERESVQDVLVAIRDLPDPDADRDANAWPRSDTVFLVTSSSLKEVERWTKALLADETNDMGTTWLTTSREKPAGAPDLLPGMNVFTLWWN